MPNRTPSITDRALAAFSKGPQSRKSLMKETGMSRTSVERTLGDLRRRGILRPVRQLARGEHEPAVYEVFAPAATPAEAAAATPAPQRKIAGPFLLVESKTYGEAISAGAPAVAVERYDDVEALKSAYLGALGRGVKPEVFAKIDVDVSIEIKG